MDFLKAPKTVRLRTLFLGYLGLLFAGTLLGVTLLLALYYTATAAGGILPANAVENRINDSREALTAADKLTDELVPDLARFAVFAPDGTYRYGSMGPGETAKAWAWFESGRNQGSRRYFTSIRRDDEIRILSYPLTMQFHSPALRKVLPNPELMGILVFLAGFLALMLALSAVFGRKVSRRLAGLQTAAENILRRDLDFDVRPGGIYEIDRVAESLRQLKDELKQSLTQQWELEATRREQISALAHDIKTPLTIVRGNAELLSDAVEDPEQQEYLRYVLNGAERMERYLADLIDLSKGREEAALRPERTEAAHLIGGWEEQLRALGAEKRIDVRIETDRCPAFVQVDPKLLDRAILNVVANAVEHTPEGGRITLRAQGTPQGIRITVTDSGPGFTAADRKSATDWFYRGDPSRESGIHHGMGLSIAQTIVRRHGGELSLTNDPVSGGGRVTIELPMAQEGDVRP